MKKLVFAFAAIVAVSFAACGNKTEQAAPVDAQEVVEEVADSLVEDTLANASDSAAQDSAAVEQAQ